jgi:hypothetical protein
MGLEAKWTLVAEAREYRKTLALEQAMKRDADLRSRWVADQETFENSHEDEELMEEVEALSEGEG